MGTDETRRYAAVPALPRTALWVAAYVVASLLGPVVDAEPAGVGLVSPAAGVALLWLASGNGRTGTLDVALLTVVTAAVALLTGDGLPAAALSLFVVVQSVLAVGLLSRVVPGLWGAGGRRSIARLREYGLFLAAIASAAVVTALLHSAASVLFTDASGWSMVFGWAGRNTAGMLVVGTFGLLLGGALVEARESGERLRVVPTRTEALHLAGILTATSLVFAIGFQLNPEAPTAFVLTLMALWAALRLEPVTVSAYCLATGATAMVMTALGNGPIARIPDLDTRALIAQLFVTILMVVGMTVALSRQQFFETIVRLQRSEETLAARASELDLMLEKLDEGVAIIDENGVYMHANSVLPQIFLADPTSEVLDPDPGRTAGHFHLFHPDGRPLADDELPHARAIRGEAVEAQEYLLRRPSISGGRVLSISAIPLPVEPGALRRALVTVRDVTASIAQRDSLVAFATTVAHDLNNPLTVIDGWAEALEDEIADADTVPTAAAAPMVQHIRAGVDQMRSFVTDLLSHAIARDQSLQCEPVSLRNVVKQIVATRNLPRGVGEVQTGQLLNVWADRLLVQQVLDNLIGNALKYVAPGVHPHVRVYAEQISADWARIRVRDNGIGIPEDQHELIFQSFHRADPGVDKGTGLGLSICRRIVERHGGRISVRSNPDGIGSCFEFTMPTTEAAFRAGTGA